MIRINLLPESYRRAERTSPKVFAAALIGVILVCSSLGWFGMVYFGDLEKVIVKHKGITETLAGVKKRAAYYDDLVRERKEFSKRKETIYAIARGRMMWVRFLDELISVVTNEGNYERHVAWFHSMQIRGSRDGRKGPSVVLPGAVQGGDLRKIANIIDDVEASNFYQNIGEPSMPSGVKKIDVGLFPPESFTFSWRWQFLPPDKWAKNRGVGKPGK